jgi:hypothetical protein
MPDHDVSTNSLLLIQAIGQNNNWVWESLASDEGIAHQNLPGLA